MESQKSDQEHKLSLVVVLNEMGIPREASLFLLSLWDSFQMIDDVEDGDLEKVTGERLAQTIFSEILLNPWFQANISVLAPIIYLQVMKWIGANEMERKRVDFHKAYMWRAGYYDIILYVASMFGPVSPASVAAAYGESITDYLNEMEVSNA